MEIHCSHDRVTPLVELVPNPRNSNKHPARQIALLAKIIKHKGWRAPIVVSNRSGFILAGHGRYEAAKLLGLEKVPVNFQDFETEADEWAHLIADNRIAELAETDAEALNALVAEIGDNLDLELAAIVESQSTKELEDISNKIGDRYEVVIECANEVQQQEVFERLAGEGLTCRVLTF